MAVGIENRDKLQLADTESVEAPPARRTRCGNFSQRGGSP